MIKVGNYSLIILVETILLMIYGPTYLLRVKDNKLNNFYFLFNFNFILNLGLGFNIIYNYYKLSYGITQYHTWVLVTSHIIIYYNRI